MVTKGNVEAEASVVVKKCFSVLFHGHSSSDEEASLESEPEPSLSESASFSQSTNGCASFRNRLSSSPARPFSSAQADSPQA